MRTQAAQCLDSRHVNTTHAAPTTHVVKRPTEQEETAIKAVFSFQRVIEVPRRLRPTPNPNPNPNPKSGKSRTTPVVEVPKQHKSTFFPKLKKDTADIWEGWRFVGDELIDGGGNRYGQNEIRAIFYNRQLLRMYRSELDRLRPPPKPREPEQLTLGFDPAWKVFATR